MADVSPERTVLRVADLSQRAATSFDLRPDREKRATLAAELGITEIRKLSFRGQIVAHGKSDWLLSAELGATVVQPCVATLDDVTTRIDTTVSRRFIAGLSFDGTEDEVEMPGDDSQEALGPEIDLTQVMTEALALALPDYPRSAHAEPVETTFAAPGVTPMADQETKPFAGLAGLKDKLKKPD